MFLSEYHRRIPADGLSVYAEGVWDQIVNNKDLDLPTQQELLAQFRCDEIAREVLVGFDSVVAPLEEQQAEATRTGKPTVLPDLGATGAGAREKCVKTFETQASRYHKGVYGLKRTELESKIDTRLKALYLAQLTAAHKNGVSAFSEAVANAVKAGQKAGGSYEFAEIVEKQKGKTLEIFKKEAKSLLIPGVAWTNFKPQYHLFEKDLDQVSAKLRKEEMRRLAIRVERWVKSRLGDAIGLEFNRLGSGRGGSGVPENETEKPGSNEKDLWDRIWNVFTGVVTEAGDRFTDRAKSFDATEEEVQVGLWRLRRKSWVALRERISEEVMESNILMKLRENFEDKFRYDEAGVPRIWRPSDDIEGIYTRARESTMALIPLLSHFRLAESYGPPDLVSFVGNQPAGVEAEDEEDLVPIGGIDEEEGVSLEEEMTVLNESKRQDLVSRFKKMADGVYVEAKRSAIGGITQVPLYFYGILLLLGWNEIVMGMFLLSLSPLFFCQAYANDSMQSSATPSYFCSSSSWEAAPTLPTLSTCSVPCCRWPTRRPTRPSRSARRNSATSSRTTRRRGRRSPCRQRLLARWAAGVMMTASAWTGWTGAGRGGLAVPRMVRLTRMTSMISSRH